MLRAYKVFLILGLTMFGLWGCSKAPSSEGASAAARVQKLEDELRAAQSERDTYRQKVTNTEDQLRTEIYRTQALQKERDDLTTRLREKTEEATEMTKQYDGFRKNLKELLGQAEVAVAPKSKFTAVPTSLTKPEAKN
jgi:chromosome segregation ATPase